MKRLLILFVILCFVFAGEKHRHEEFIHLTEEQIKELGIKLYTVKKKPAQKILKFPAEVRENPLTTYKVFSPVEGILKKLYVKEGDAVKKGDILAEVYSPELASLVSEVESAKVRVESAKKLFLKNKELYAQKVIKYLRYYNSMVEYERAKGEYEALLGRLKSIGEVRNYNLLIRSPGDGYVVSQNVVMGDSVGLDTLLFEIHKHEVLWVYGWAPLQSVKELKVGMEGEVLLNGEFFPCNLTFIAHEVDTKTRRVKVRCEAKNKNHTLRPGEFVTLLFKVGGKPGLLIPKSAVQEVEGKKVVFVKAPDGFEPRSVKILKEIDGYYVVGEGLKEGEKVAVSGTIFLKTMLTGVEEGGHAH